MKPHLGRNFFATLFKVFYVYIQIETSCIKWTYQKRGQIENIHCSQLTITCITGFTTPPASESRKVDVNGAWDSKRLLKKARLYIRYFGLDKRRMLFIYNISFFCSKTGFIKVKPHTLYVCYLLGPIISLTALHWCQNNWD